MTTSRVTRSKTKSCCSARLSCVRSKSAIEMADVLVIGGGVAGLATALVKAKEGAKVLVLEQGQAAGGCVRSFKLGNNVVDTALYQVGGLERGGMLRDAFESLGLMILPWERVDNGCVVAVHQGGRTYCLPQGRKDLIDVLKKEFPKEEHGLDLFAELMDCPDVEWMHTTNAWGYLRTILKDRRLLQILSAMVLDMTELRKKSLSLFSFVQILAPRIMGNWKLGCSAEVFVGALVRQIEALGGHVFLGKEVVSLQVQDGRVSEAVCRDGSRYGAEWYVSAIHPRTLETFFDKSDLNSESSISNVRTMEDSCGMFCLHLSLRSGSLQYFRHTKVVMKGQTCWDTPIGSDLRVSCITIHARRVAKGSSVAVLSILSPMLWETVEPYKDSSSKRRPKAYKEMKSKLTEQCLELAEVALPGLKDMVEESVASTPLTHYTRLASPHGTAFGLRRDAGKTQTAVLSPDTGLANLIQTGQNLLLQGLQGVMVSVAHTLERMT